MIALKFALRNGRSLAANCVHPLAVTIVLWILVVTWSAWIAFQWLRDASATSAPPAVAQSRPALDLDAAVATAAAAPVFGVAPASEATATALVVPLDIKLKGVFAGGAGPMAAIVNAGDEEDRVVTLGRELQPGVLLEGVFPTHILVARNGASHRIELETLKNEAPRSKAAARGHRARATHPPAADPPIPATEAPSEAAEAESSVPLAPPMPQSGVGDRSTLAHHVIR